MKSLRARFAVILVSSIIGVCIIATSVTFLLMCRFDELRFGASVPEQIKQIAPLFENRFATLDSSLARNVAGKPDSHLTEMLREQFRRAGADFDVVVTRLESSPYPMASVKIGSGWLSIPIPDYGPPPETWLGLLGWMCLIAIGTGGVAWGVAHVMTRHLAMLETLALTIGRDGQIPKWPECGPAEYSAAARALNTMATRLAAAVESRMRLVAAAGHDLRTPMTRMRLRAEFLAADERPMWLADLEELDRIADSAIKLVSEEANSDKYQRIRIDEMVSGICRDLAAIGLSVTMLSAKPATISSAPLQLTRALRNLITNAATHGGGAAVRVETLHGAAVIAIEDEGPGIPEDVMPRVFEPFFRVDSARRKSIPGAGLGLAIAKEIIERHSGNVTLQNRSPRGLRQEISFAVATA